MITTKTPRIKFSDLAGFTDKQRQATHAAEQHKYFLYGGSRGPGKSYWLRWYLIYRLLKWAGQGHRGVRVLLACEDYPTLRERQIVKVEAEFPAWLGRYYSGERKEFVLSDTYGGGVIKFGNLADVGNYLSSEFAIIAIDELVRNRFSVFNRLRGSLRWPGLTDTGFVAATNPEANWVRSVWIERRFEDELQPLAPIADQFSFLPGLPTDNPHLPVGYWDMLNTLTGALRQAWLHGDWYAAVEGLVYDNFSQANITDREPEPDQPIELAIDDGYIDPRATLFIQRSGSHILVFDELYHSKRLEEETIAEIEEKCRNAPWATDRADGVKLPELAAVSHEAVALRERLDRSNIAAQNWMTRRAGGGQSTRLQAIQLTRSLICDGNGHRTILIHKRCRNLLDEISAGYKYTEGRRGLNEKPADGNDHACQALESWVWLRAEDSGSLLLW